MEKKCEKMEVSTPGIRSQMLHVRCHKLWLCMLDCHVLVLLVHGYIWLPHMALCVCMREAMSIVPRSPLLSVKFRRLFWGSGMMKALPLRTVLRFSNVFRNKSKISGIVPWNGAVISTNYGLIKRCCSGCCTLYKNAENFEKFRYFESYEN